MKTANDSLKYDSSARVEGGDKEEPSNASEDFISKVRPEPATLVGRKDFLKTLGLFSFAAISVEGLGVETSPGIGRVEHSDLATAQNNEFHLTLAIRQGLEVKLRHTRSQMLLANGAYSYSFGAPRFPQILESREKQLVIFTLKSATGSGLQVTHQFRVPLNAPWIEEQITIQNKNSFPVPLPYGRCGFVLPLQMKSNNIEGPWQEFNVSAVPFRREPSGHLQQYADYGLREVLTQPRRSDLRFKENVIRYGNMVSAGGQNYKPYPEYASEGWALCDGRKGFLITKYSQHGMELAILDRLALAGGVMGLRWGGFGIFQGDPEEGAWLAPYDAHQFGVTRLTAWNGGLKEGFLNFRSEMESRGHGCPNGFDPPVHWNELYDNKLWWLGEEEQDKPVNRKKFYLLDDMKKEAEKAREFGCEALYLDPGWDTNFASKIWDESRLGTINDFVSRLRTDYGLSLSLHTPLSGWCNPSTYDRRVDRMNRAKKPIERSLCGASRLYVEETARRLLALAEGGAKFFMFDGTQYAGECWDAHHGHSVPSTREEHVQATNQLARLVHAKYPDILIEMHDQMLGPTMLRYVPIYYGHGRPVPVTAEVEAAGFDSVWAFELMWDPMTDLVGGNSIALYYYNLAYSLPLYIHIDLRKDNSQALMFWWNASTCRHLGIGGTHSDPSVRAAHKAAMKDYRRFKPFFTAGKFFGIDELTHVHRHPKDNSAVINCFNLRDRTFTREINFEGQQFELDGQYRLEIKGGNIRKNGTNYAVEVTIAPYGHTLLELVSVPSA